MQPPPILVIYRGRQTPLVALGQNWRFKQILTTAIVLHARRNASARVPASIFRAKAFRRTPTCIFAASNSNTIREGARKLNYSRSVLQAKAEASGPQKEHMAQLGPACVSQDSSTGILQDSIEHHVKTVDPLIIRDQCDCERCVDPSSHQKLFQSSDIPSSIRPREITLKSNEARLTWENDIRSYPADHTTVISWNRIEDIFNGELPKRPTTWARSAFTKNHVRFQWPSARRSSESLYGLLTELSRHGIVFLEGMPGLDEDDPGRSSNYGVEQIGAEIGPLRDSFYGRTWDVKSVANAKNIAYTHQHLGLHMDLL